MNEQLNLSDLVKVIDALKDEDRAALIEMTREVLDKPFIPSIGPQTDALNCEADLMLYGGAAGGGKLLKLGQEILTTDGWKTMATVEPGDYVFGSDGRPALVTAKSDVEVPDVAYAVVFNTGEEVTCDARHQWLTLNDDERMKNLRRTDEWRTKRRLKRESRALSADNLIKPSSQANITKSNQEREYEYLDPIAPQTRTAQEIADTLHVRKSRANHSVGVAAPLQFPGPVELPIEPYVLGVWLGDGTTANGDITMLPDDIDEMVKHIQRGIVSRATPKNKTAQTLRLENLRKDLRVAGLLGNKHIPRAYQRAGNHQRLELLQGLMDTDGHALKDGQLEIALSHEELISDVRELLSGLGIKTTIRARHFEHKAHKTSYRIKFSAPFPVFKFPRKLERQNLKPKDEYIKRRYITAVEPAEPEPMACISVGSEDRSYLVGRTFITTHNSALEIGCAALNHREGIIFRREATQLDGLITFSYEVFDGIGDFNKNDKLWVFERPDPDPDKPPITCRLKFAGMPQPDDWRKYAGVARDYMAFDEAGEFLKEQVFSLFAWLRTTIKGQRTRIILGSNPPRGGDGEWMLEEFAPWLVDNHPNKARPGELRWAIVVKNETEWVDGPGIYTRDGEEYEALSRTFIPSKLDDNPYYRDSKYRAQLQSLPEPLRSQLLYGSFTAGRDDHDWQVIPSRWIRDAQARWTDRSPEHTPMTATACDIAQGGPDKTQIQSRYEHWFSKFHTRRGDQTPDGPTAAAEIVKVMRDRCRVVVDAGGGYGGDALTQLAHADVDCYGYDGTRRAMGRTRDGLFTFRNFRAQAVWALREALDPEYGATIALPPDPELYADLCAYRYEIKGVRSTGGEVLVGPKEEMKERLGRSPDKGDTTIMLHVSHSGVLKRPKAAQNRDAQRKPQQLKAITASQTKMKPRKIRKARRNRKDNSI